MPAFILPRGRTGVKPGLHKPLDGLHPLRYGFAPARQSDERTLAGSHNNMEPSMARARKSHAAAEATESGPEPVGPTVDAVVEQATHQAAPAADVFDQQIAARQAEQALQQHVHDQAVHAVQNAREPGDDGEDKQATAQNGQKKAAYTGILEALPDGTKTHYRDYGNREGVAISIEYADKQEKPPADVLEPLKEEHKGHDRHRYDTQHKDWHKHVRRNPVAERLDSEERYEAMTERLRADRARRAERQHGGPTP